ncbi:MAG: hypothetical protein ACFFBH_08755 [Promethearchaeota archaeon]
MEQSENKTSKKKSHAGIRLLLLIIYVILLFVIYQFFIITEHNLLVGILLSIFSFLIFVGPIFQYQKTKRMYQRLFPDKNKRIKEKYDKKRLEEKKKKDFEFYKKKIPMPIDLEYNYKKSLIQKCLNCGTIVPSFVKKCPNCGASLE